MFGFFNVDFERFFNGKGFSIMELKIEEYFSINLVILLAVTNFKIFFFLHSHKQKKSVIKKLLIQLETMFLWLVWY